MAGSFTDDVQLLTTFDEVFTRNYSDEEIDELKERMIQAFIALELIFRE